MEGLGRGLSDTVEAPRPTTLRPPSSRCTVTSPMASVPLVTPWISYRRSLAAVLVTCEMARQTASTGPSPMAGPSCVTSLTRTLTVAVGMANKEVLVSGGSLVMQAVRQYGAELLPVDSEHN